MDAALVVSPYLVSIEPEHVPAPDEVGDRGLRERLRQHDHADGAEVFLDALGDRLVVVGRADAAFLRRHRDRTIEPERLSPDDARAAARLRGILLLPRAEVWTRHNYKWLDVEINTHCNYRCSFCPVSTQPAAPRFMPPELFTLVLRRMNEYGAKVLGLDFFNEPTLDPSLLERLRGAREHGIAVKLYSNGSVLDEARLRAIAEIGIASLTINLPTLDPEQFHRVTGSRRLPRVLETVETACRLGIPTSLSVNSPAQRREHDLVAIRRRFGHLLSVPSRAWPTGSRGGAVEVSDYGPPVRHEARLSGCMVALHKMNVTVDGTVLLCCEDFSRQHVLGDLRASSLRELAEGEVAVAYRRRIFGGEDAPAGFICRGCRATTSRAAGRFRCGPYPFAEGATGRAQVRDAFGRLPVLVAPA